MRNHITKASFINFIEEGCILITYSGEGFDGKITIYINEFFPCPVGKLRTFLKEYREPLGGEYIPMCWSLYYWLSEEAKHCGVRGKLYGRKILQNLDVLAQELKIK